MSQAHVVRQQAEQFFLKHRDLAEAIAELVLEERTRENGELVGGLTPTLRKTFDYLVHYEGKHGFSPSYTEMCEALTVGRVSVARMLRLLKERGYISYIKNKARSISILPAGREIARSTRSPIPRQLAA